MLSKLQAKFCVWDRPIWYPFCWLLFVWMFLGLLSGCNQPGIQPGVWIEVRGEIYLDSQPVSGARVVFVPDNLNMRQEFAISYGWTDATGNFQLESRDGRRGALVAKHRVFISTANQRIEKSPVDRLETELQEFYPGEDVPESNAEMRRMLLQASHPLSDESVPIYYNAQSELTCEIVKGEPIQQIRFDLSSVDPLLRK